MLTGLRWNREIANAPDSSGGGAARLHLLTPTPVQEHAGKDTTGDLCPFIDHDACSSKNWELTNCILQLLREVEKISAQC